MKKQSNTEYNEIHKDLKDGEDTGNIPKGWFDFGTINPPGNESSPIKSEPKTEETEMNEEIKVQMLKVYQETEGKSIQTLIGGVTAKITNQMET